MHSVLDGCILMKDSMLLVEHESPQEIRFIQQRLHIEYSEANSIIYPWLEQVMTSK